MKPQYPRNSQRRGRGPRRPSDRPHQEARSSSPSAPTKLSFWQRLKAFFGGSSKPAQAKTKSSQSKPAQQGRSSRQPESIEVTSAKLYVGNLSFDAVESDLSELFNGVGAVRSTEI